MERGSYLAFGTAALLAVAIADNFYTRAQKRAAQPQAISADDLLSISGMSASAAQQALLLGSGSGQLSAEWGNPDTAQSSNGIQ
jgi:hypothetical protein